MGSESRRKMMDQNTFRIIALSVALLLLVVVILRRKKKNSEED